MKKITPTTIEFSFGGPDVERKLGSTKLEASWDEKHWCAPVTTRLTKYELEDSDSEGAGYHALQYELLQVGKFKRCVH
jgi:hypothetical protein